MPRKTHPFWRYSLRVYARAGVEQACLALQEAGADVNLLLFCCWQGSQGGTLNKQSLRKAMQAVAVWQQQVVQPLRQARRIIKRGLPGVASDMSGSLRQRISRVELDAEYLEQLVLAQHATATPQSQPTIDPQQIAAVNLKRYLELLGIPFVTSVKRPATVLLGASA
jgi:uncharacterized protein (TIGR02444 family)